MSSGHAEVRTVFLRMPTCALTGEPWGFVDQQTQSITVLFWMEEVQARHRMEAKDLQSQITQKKKAANKKARKAVNDECDRLEGELKVRHAQELAAQDDAGEGAIATRQEDRDVEQDDDLLATITGPPSIEKQTQNLSLNGDSEDTSGSSRKPNRQKARLARRREEQDAAVAQAAEEAANMPDLKQRERNRMLEEFKKRGLVEKEVAANGHCMYSAIADQMRQLGLRIDSEAGEEEQDDSKELHRDDYKTVRRKAAAYVSGNPEDFVPFLEEPVEDYVQKIRDTGEWGGQLELLALAKTYNVKIHVVQGDGRVEEVDSGEDEAVGDAWLAYYRHGFGLGEHYNSLRSSNGP